MYYATHDYDQGFLDEDAGIKKFTTIEEVEAWLLQPYDRDEWLSLDIVPAAIGDCWFKMYDKPRVGSRIYAPFSYTQLIISPPGSHPGGKAYWITPSPDVLIVEAVALPEED